MTESYGGNFNTIDLRGFTLLEVLIAMVVATVGLLSLSMMQLNTIKVNGISNKATQATFLAQKTLERIKDGNMVDDGTFGFIDMSGTKTGIVQDAGILSGINVRGETGGPFTIQWQVFTNTDWSRRVAVDVSWSGMTGMARRVRLASISRGDGN
ncbi:MAG: prepilin-type N-terminal cleavage/methylation domain-containing protein [Desulfobacteraceae bacterium]|jgi:prepilin-type N-terminal cleavage/methylation domain-containing protein